MRTDPQRLSQTSTEEQQVRMVFDRMARQIGRVAKDPKPENVHRFRTNSRRVEVLVANLSPENGNTRKLLKRLAKLRRKAGKVRDLDVQIEFLKTLKIPDRKNQRVLLLDSLSNEQRKQSKKFADSLDHTGASKLRKRLRKARTEIDLSEVDILKLAFSRLPKLSQSPLNEKTLHACRISAKHARYLGELSGDSRDARVLVDELKKAQDEIGRWHDILKLTERAKMLFGGVRDSSLVSALENISHARFRRAASALQNALKNLADLGRRTGPVAESKLPPSPAGVRLTAA